MDRLELTGGAQPRLTSGGEAGASAVQGSLQFLGSAPWRSRPYLTSGIEAECERQNDFVQSARAVLASKVFLIHTGL